MPAEESAAAAHRRLFEEMGLRVALTPVFQLYCRLPLPEGLIEHEFGHVFFGITARTPAPDPAEAMAWRWQTLPSVAAQLAREPARFTPWFRLTMDKIPEYHAAFMHARPIG